MKDMIQFARGFAEQSHAKQKRKDGSPYFTHLERVAKSLPTPELRQIGYLHDILEDFEYTGVTEEELQKHFGYEIVKTVKALSRQKGETYFDFIFRIQSDRQAAQVKVADLLDNMRDLKEGSMKDKYRFAYFQLTGKPPTYDLSIRAEVHSDDRNVEVQFDAVPWFAQAKTEDIVNLATCGWRGDYPADNVGMFEAERNEDVAFMFKYLETIANDPMKKDYSGWECSVNPEDALAWMKINTPKVYETVVELLEEES